MTNTLLYSLLLHFIFPLFSDTVYLLTCFVYLLSICSTVLMPSFLSLSPSFRHPISSHPLHLSHLLIPPHPPFASLLSTISSLHSRVYIFLSHLHLSLSFRMTEKWVCPGDWQPATDPRLCHHGNWVSFMVAMAVKCVCSPATGVCVCIYVCVCVCSRVCV